MTSPRLFALGSRFVPATCLSLALGVSAALACPGLALADAPPQAPTATPAGSGTAALPPSGTAAQPPALPPSDTAAQPPSGGDAQPPSGALTPAPATAPPKELPASVLAMQGKDVVLRLDEGPAVVGRLESVNNQVFYVRDPTGAINGIPRSRVRGIRLSEVQSAPAPNYYSGTPNSYSGAPNYTGAPYYSPEPSQGAPGDPQFPHRERSIGFGTAFGGGFSGSGRSVNGAILFPQRPNQRARAHGWPVFDGVPLTLQGRGYGVPVARTKGILHVARARHRRKELLPARVAVVLEEPSSGSASDELLEHAAPAGPVVVVAAPDVEVVGDRL